MQHKNQKQDTDTIIDLEITETQEAIFRRAAQKEGGTLEDYLKKALAGNL